MRILFVLTLDKFTEGLYRFFSKYFDEYEKEYIIYGPQKQYYFNVQAQNIYWIESYRDLRVKTDIKQKILI